MNKQNYTSYKLAKLLFDNNCRLSYNYIFDASREVDYRREMLGINEIPIYDLLNNLCKENAFLIFGNEPYYKGVNVLQLVLNWKQYAVNILGKRYEVSDNVKFISTDHIKVFKANLKSQEEALDIEEFEIQLKQLTQAAVLTENYKLMNIDVTGTTPAWEHFSSKILYELIMGRKQKAEEILWDNCVFNSNRKTI